MRLRRVAAITFAAFGVIVISCVLYLAFGDLGRHKTRLAALVTEYTGRDFAIEGALKLKLYPDIIVVADRVRFANAGWGSKPQMAQAEHLSAEIRFMSLFSGPVEVRSFELSNVDVLLEKRRNGDANWLLRESASEEDEPAEPKTRTQFPLVIEKAKLTNVSVTYRTDGKPAMVARLDSLTISPGDAGLLALDGRGKFDEYPITLKGEAGPIDSLLAGRDIRMALDGTLGRLRLDINGVFGDLDPLEGTDLKIKATGQDVGAMFERLNLPVFATGALAIDAQIKSAGKRTQFNLDGMVGDLSAKTRGSLSGLYLRGSDLTFEATAADAARLAKVFGVEGVPAGPLSVSGHVMPARKEIKFEMLKAHLAGGTAQIDGTLKRGRHREISLRFVAGIENLAKLREGLPHSAFSAAGDLIADEKKLAVSGLKTTFGENQVNGTFSITHGEPDQIEADLASPRLDLTPFFPQAGTTPKQTSGKEVKDKLFFSDAPLPILQLKGTAAKLHVVIAELALANKTLKDVDANVTLDHDHVELQSRARGSLGGTVETSLRLEPVGTDSANVNLKFNLEDVRAGLDMKEMNLDDVPPLGVKMDLATNGKSTRQLAANANGHVLMTQGPGNTKAEFLNAFGGDVLSQLRTKLNPFRAEDPFTRLDCTVVRADIVDGAVTVNPILMQTQKVTIAAHGTVNLRDEHLSFEFDTRPRKGIGVSPGMFTNPFIRLEGTMMNPRIAMGAKGVTSGAVAAATGGLSVVAGGVVDRIKGEADMCHRALEKATGTKPG